MPTMSLHFTEEEISNALKQYVLDEIKPGYDSEFKNIEFTYAMTTNNKAVCDITAEIIDKETTK